MEHECHPKPTTTGTTNGGDNQAPVESNSEVVVEDNAVSHRIPVVAINPGVRTFVMTFDTEGNEHEFGGDSLSEKIMLLCLMLDKLQSCWT